MGTLEAETRAHAARNRVTALKRNLRRSCCIEALEAAGNDTKNLWKLINQITKKNKKSSQFTEINGKCDRKDMAEEFNKFFCDISPSLASKILDSMLNLNFDKNPDQPYFEFHDVDCVEVKKLMFKISDAEATGHVGLPIRFLKLAHESVVPILVHIINCSLHTLTIPNDRKIAVVSPLFKEGDRTVAYNYRPISILPAVSKVLEHVVHVQVYKYIESNSILSDAQFGFRKGHSTTSCVLNLLDVIYKSIDNNKFIGVVFLDLKKAFDTVDHGLLLQKLSKYGLADNAVLWFENYISNRKQCTKVSGCKSNLLNITCGGSTRFDPGAPFVYFIY